MTIRNPKQEGSNLWDCKPQVGLCPLNCNQCFYNRPGAFYVDINQPHFPTVEEVGEGIVRVNCGHDSNIEREKVIRETAIYKHRFFNTSMPRFDFPAPVVFTANREEEKPPLIYAETDNVMYVRLRVSTTNLEFVQMGVDHYIDYIDGQIPVVLTFMAYYEDPPDKNNYEWKVRHINSYWCAKKEFILKVLEIFKDNRFVTMCGTPDSNYCRDCKNCETYYWQTVKRLSIQKTIVSKD